jgi:hypothetical protein
MKDEVKKAFWLFLVLLLTWQGIYLIASAYPILYDYWLLAYLGVSASAICFVALDKQKISELGFKKPKEWRTSAITNYRFSEVDNLHRPITMNNKGVLDDVKKLQKLNNKRGVIFVVFPLVSKNIEWENHIKKIRVQLSNLKNTEFKFRNNVPAIIYFGII